MHRVLRAGIVVLALHPLTAIAEDTLHFDPDVDPSRMDWTKMSKALGPAPSMRGQRFGIVIKTMTNEYWRQMAAGYRQQAAADGVKLDIQAAQSESDQVRQLAIMGVMIGSGYAALLISPQSSTNLQPAIDGAVAAKVPVVDVDGAVVDNVHNFVGSTNRSMGVRVAQWFVDHYPDGGNVAIVQGQAGVFSTVRRSAGFRETLEATQKFKVVASVPGDWEKQKAFDAAVEVMRRDRDLIGFYCNNDTMALGVVDAVKSLNRQGAVRVFGTDGTAAAYASIKAGELTGTVDIFPKLTGQIGLEVAQRLSAGQSLPRVIETPQALITRDSVARYEVDDQSLRVALMDDAQRRR